MQDVINDVTSNEARPALEVFCIYEAQGEYFDISEPSHVVRDSFCIGSPEVHRSGYYVGKGCIGCKLCYSVCPQKCIDISRKPVVIDQSRCLQCGRCAGAQLLTVIVCRLLSNARMSFTA